MSPYNPAVTIDNVMVTVIKNLGIVSEISSCRSFQVCVLESGAEVVQREMGDGQEGTGLDPE